MSESGSRIPEEQMNTRLGRRIAKFINNHFLIFILISVFSTTATVFIMLLSAAEKEFGIRSSIFLSFMTYVIYRVSSGQPITINGFISSGYRISLLTLIVIILLTCILVIRDQCVTFWRNLPNRTKNGFFVIIAFILAITHSIVEYSLVLGSPIEFSLPLVVPNYMMAIILILALGLFLFNPSHILSRKD